MSSNPSLGYSKMAFQVQNGVRNIQKTPVVVMSISIFCQMDNMHYQDEHSDSEFQQSNSTSGTQQAMLNLSETHQ